MAAEIESAFNEESRLVESSGGIFEVEHAGQLVFSKKAVGRFPGHGEVPAIVKALAAGVGLTEAQAQAQAGIPSPPTFAEWLSSAWKRLSAKAP